MIKKLLFQFLILAALLSSCSFIHRGSAHKNNYVSFDLDSIRKRGRLIAVTDFNSTNYFIYKGEPMGFHYELLKSFSDHIGIDLDIVTENIPGKAVEMLNTGKADLLAFDMTVDQQNRNILFTEPLGVRRQVLVQRKPRNWRSLTNEAADKKLVKNQLALAGKTIYVQAGSSQADCLRTLAVGSGSIKIIEVPYESEKLIQHVAEGEIDYTICDENVAQVNASYFPDIDVNTALSLDQNYAWGVRKTNSSVLLGELNRWIMAYKKTYSYALLYAKYFKNSSSSIIIRSDYYALNTGKVSRYDDLIRKFSPSIDWDWRLLAAMICQESRFDPKVISVSGAYGLMQIMPSTGQDFGIDSTASPENNLKAGINYIKSLNAIFDPIVPDRNERINFILAAYNAGPGHVLDAMKLAAKNGKDPQKWDDNVAIWMMKKSDPRYYTDSVVKNGYYNGIISVAYVSEILDRYAHYKNIIP